VHANIDHLLCAEEVPLAALHGSQSLSLTLVDHNCFGQAFEQFAEASVEILDHHVDLGAYPWLSGDSRDIAFAEGRALVGSTCTIVAERFFKAADKEAAYAASAAAGAGVGEGLLDSAVATLLMGIIALDTINMSPQAGIGTTRDAAALARLQVSPCMQLHVLRPA
jgi:inorganic pyrophosphatase/exopolyphosphatase